MNCPPVGRVLRLRGRPLLPLSSSSQGEAARHPRLMPSARIRKNSRAKRHRSRSGSSSSWVEATLRRMTLREKLGQMLMPEYVGLFAPAENPEHQRMLHEIEDNQVGGLILGTARGRQGIRRSQLYPTAVTTNEWQRRSKIPLLIGADFENGTAMRIEEGTPFPSAMSIGATGDPSLAGLAGKDIALEGRAAGVHWIFAPDADVNNNPANPIINTRSFGEDPRMVADCAAHFIRGAQRHGALAMAKHFPGHGNVSVDSHLALATVSASRAELDRTELIPFRAAIAAGVDSIMPGHLAVPALEPETGVPATLSPKILTDLLRGEMKFRGLIVTDAMDMRGVANSHSPGDAAVRAVKAGADVLLMPPSPDAAIRALEAAVRSGEIPEARIEASVRHILGAKARLGLHRSRFVDISRLAAEFGRPEFAADALKIADRGVTLLRNDHDRIPLDATKPLRVLLLALSADPDSLPGEILENELGWRADSLTVVRGDPRFSPIATVALPDAETYDVAIAALFVRVADRKGNVALPEDQGALVNRLLGAGKPAIVASFGSPYLIGRFPGAKTWLANFGTNRVAQTAAARAIFGQIEISGKLPVSVPGAAKCGDGIRVAANPMLLEAAPTALSQRLRPAFAIVDRGIAEGAFPGAVLAVGWRNRVAVRAFGKLAYGAKGAARAAAETDTIYDAASLTKPVVTTTAAMMLCERKQLDLDSPVARYLPEFRESSRFDPEVDWRSRITVRMLLLHDSGLPAHREYFKETKGYQAILARAIAEPLAREPGTQIEYSDLGFMLLGEIIQRITGQSLGEFAKERIFEPLGMRHSLFNPPRKLRPRIAPTERDVTLRKRVVQGQVHDENAWAMGGIAGHAGLFSTAGDIAAFAQMILNGGIYAHRRILRRETIREFTAGERVGRGARALGWDVPTPSGSAAGRHFSGSAFGHTGFTGTSLWIDPERELFVAFLTNRVNPTRANERIRQVRPAVHDAVVEALGLATAPPSHG